jgi:hypothetical protein
MLARKVPRLERMLGSHAVASHWGELPQRERQILIMDLRSSMTQTQIAQRLSTSQMHVSRLRAHALDHDHLALRVIRRLYHVVHVLPPSSTSCAPTESSSPTIRNELLVDFPYLDRADVLAALEFAAAAVQERELPVAQ